MRIKMKIITNLLLIASLVFLGSCQSMMRGMGMIPMGGSDDVDFSKQLWKSLSDANLVGANGKTAKPYKGAPPHGKILEFLHQEITVKGYTGLALVKRNYKGPDVSIENVNSDRAKYLKAVTVMFKREDGYDKDNKNWFWAKFKPDGSLHVKSKMMMNIPLAGRVAKGKSEGCIHCHASAPGGDYVYAQDITIN